MYFSDGTLLDRRDSNALQHRITEEPMVRIFIFLDICQYIVKLELTFNVLFRWDTAGQERFKCIAASYTEEPMVRIFIFLDICHIYSYCLFICTIVYM